jgi:hypothetical protein
MYRGGVTGSLAAQVAALYDFEYVIGH